MKITILGAGIIGISTAWHLLERGHQVTIVDRQPNASMETSFANAAQISVSYCEPWANRDAPLKARAGAIESVTVSPISTRAKGQKGTKKQRVIKADQVVVAGTIEVGDYDLTLDSPVARARCRMLSNRIEQVMPGVCDTRTPEDGGDPAYWAGRMAPVRARRWPN